jgi:protein required for attachment to host cells
MSLSVVKELNHPQSRLRDQELVSDESGRLDKGGRGILSAMDPPVDPHDQEAKRFAKTVAAVLNEGVARNACQGLALIAPAHFFGLLKMDLSTQAARKLDTCIVKDLTHLPLHELNERLHQIIDAQPAPQHAT